MSDRVRMLREKGLGKQEKKSDGKNWFSVEEKENANSKVLV